MSIRLGKVLMEHIGKEMGTEAKMKKNWRGWKEKALGSY